MSKTYKTAMGKTIDMRSMSMANEKIRAVGNMNVNARGDLIDSNNNIVKTRQQQLAEQYNTQTKKQNRPGTAQKPQADKPQAEPVKSKDPLPEPVTVQPTHITEDIDFPQDVAEDDVEIVKEESQPVKPATGLAAAIAKTKETKK
jgi:hypothetical protein